MIKVASYCRVSTDKDDQVNSFEAQCRYFKELIQSHRDWELYDVYADEGITGTNTKKRIQFNRMINDAFAGKFQLIITKEVSRFSRNILDTIAYTRELKRIGVGVLFVLDGINTMNPDAELYLSIMASMAQEESRKTSGRVTWGQTRQMEKGVVFGRSLLGFDVKDGRIAVNPDGAKIVRLIFDLYAVEQMGSLEIARFLARNGYRTKSGSTNWRSNTVIKILNNEKYVGDLIQKKTFTPDFLTHEKRKNRGEVPLICIKDHHEPIVTREIWNLAQKRLREHNKRAGNSLGHSNRYVFSGKIKCGECGASFVVRYKYLKNGGKYRRWSCGTTVNKGASACGIGKLLRDDDALDCLKKAIRSLDINKEAIIESVTTIAMDALTAGEGQAHDIKRLQNEITRTQQKMEAMMDSYFSKEITKAQMQSMNEKYKKELQNLNDQLRASVQQTAGKPANLQYDELRSCAASILAGNTSSDLFYKAILERITVFKDRHMELRLKELPQVFVFNLDEGKQPFH